MKDTLGDLVQRKGAAAAAAVRNFLFVIILDELSYFLVLYIRGYDCYYYRFCFTIIAQTININKL